MDRQTEHALKAHVDQMTDSLVTRAERDPWNTIGRMMYATARLRVLLGIPADSGLDTIPTKSTSPHAPPQHEPPIATTE